MRLHATLFAALIAAALVPAAQAAPGKAYGRSSDRVEVCSWDRPGLNRYTGSVAAALDRYPDIPADVRHRLRQRMEAHDYEDIALIRRDSIEGKHGYRPEIADMHFGPNRICKRITRDGWTPEMQERGLVYCEDGHCILVPTVCGNVSRISRRPEAVLPAQAFGDEPPVAPLPPAVLPEGSFEQLAGEALPPAEPLPGGAPMGRFYPLSPYGPGGFILEPPGRRPPGGPVPPVLPPPVLPPPPVTPVPEPGTWMLMAAGLGLLAWRAQRRAGVPRCATQKRS